MPKTPSLSQLMEPPDTPGGFRPHHRCTSACTLWIPEEDHLLGLLKAGCEHLRPTAVNQHDQPPPDPPCEHCRLIFLPDFTTNDISTPHGAPDEAHRTRPLRWSATAPTGCSGRSPRC